jgi:hypothetical protein
MMQHRKRHAHPSHIPCDPSGRMIAGNAVSGLKPRAKTVIPFGDIGFHPMYLCDSTARTTHTTRIATTKPVLRMTHAQTDGSVPRMGQTKRNATTNPVPWMGHTTLIAITAAIPVPRMTHAQTDGSVPRMGHTSLARGFNPETSDTALLRPEGPDVPAIRAPSVSCDPSGRMIAGNAVSGLKPRAKEFIPFGDVGFHPMYLCESTVRTTHATRIATTNPVLRMTHAQTDGPVPRMGHTSLARGFNPETSDNPLLRPEGSHEYTSNNHHQKNSEITK